MGREKLFLEAGGVPLFERVYGVLSQIFVEMIVVANNPRWFHRYMIEKHTQGDVIVPNTSDGLEPLHAIYSKGCLKPIKNLISRGNLKIVDFFTEVTVVYVSEREILKYDPMLVSFLNVNTMEDLRQAENVLTQDLWVDS